MRTLDLPNRHRYNYIAFSTNTEASNQVILSIITEGVLNAKITRKGEMIMLPSFVFTRILGDGLIETMPWNATSSLKDTLIYAKKEIAFHRVIQPGDTLTLTLGVKLITAKGVKALALEKNKEMRKLRVLKVEKFLF